MANSDDDFDLPDVPYTPLSAYRKPAPTMKTKFKPPRKKIESTKKTSFVLPQNKFLVPKVILIYSCIYLCNYIEVRLFRN